MHIKSILKTLQHQAVRRRLDEVRDARLPHYRGESGFVYIHPDVTEEDWVSSSLVRVIERVGFWFELVALPSDHQPHFEDIPPYTMRLEDGQVVPWIAPGARASTFDNSGLSMRSCRMIRLPRGTGPDTIVRALEMSPLVITETDDMPADYFRLKFSEKEN